MKSLVSLSLVFACPLLLTGLSGCEATGGMPAPSDTTSSTEVKNQDPSLRLSDAEIHQMYGTASCNALSPNSDSPPIIDPTDYARGLVATITTPRNGQQWSSLDSFGDPATNLALSNPIYFDALNVPTRNFQEGFPTFTGGLIEGPSGLALLEYFRLDFSSNLGLTSTDDEGDYDFAALADDGARVTFDGVEMINDPTITPTKLMCGTGFLSLDHSSNVPLTVNYFQGPRYQIALQLLWRKHVNGQTEPRCSQSGEGLWFDASQTPSAPQPAFKDLQSRGWSVIPAANYRLPQTEYMNPCTSSHVAAVLTPAS